MGNGISLIIFAGIVAGLPARLPVPGTWPYRCDFRLVIFDHCSGDCSYCIIVFVERAQRRVLIQYPNASWHEGYGRSELAPPLKINTAGVIRRSAAVLLMPLSVAQFTAGEMHQG
ncbi:hypothetical protein [Thalassospira alkalitolerans]|uniref:hypothetical protein n=1 Tax=Thalassospira alkalitolerans TaxID=1293890 RepID=UPI003AA83ADC